MRIALPRLQATAGRQTDTVIIYHTVGRRPDLNF